MSCPDRQCLWSFSEACSGSVLPSCSVHALIAFATQVQIEENLQIVVFVRLMRVKCWYVWPWITFLCLYIVTMYAHVSILGFPEEFICWVVLLRRCCCSVSVWEQLCPLQALPTSSILRGSFMRHIYKYSFIHSFVIIEKLLSSFIFSVKKYFQVWSSYSFLKVITVTEYVKSWNLTGLEDAILTWRMRYRPWGCNTDHEDAIQIMRMQNRPWECNTDHEDAIQTMRMQYRPWGCEFVRRSLRLRGTSVLKRFLGPFFGGFIVRTLHDSNLNWALSVSTGFSECVFR